MPVKDITIRALCAGDEAGWREIWQGYLAFYETSLPDEVYQTTFSRLLSNDPHEFHGLVAERGGRLVGLVHFLFHRHGWKIEPVCYLQDLYCVPDLRGGGIGRALIEAVYAAADAHGAPSVYWLTQEHNAPARQLYDKLATLTPFIKYQRG